MFQLEEELFLGLWHGVGTEVHIARENIPKSKVSGISLAFVAFISTDFLLLTFCRTITPVVVQLSRISIHRSSTSEINSQWYLHGLASWDCLQLQLPYQRGNLNTNLALALFI